MMHRKEHLSRQEALLQLKAKANQVDFQNKKREILQSNLEKVRGTITNYRSTTVPMVPETGSLGKVRRRDRHFPQLPKLKAAIETMEADEPFVMAQGGLGDALLALSASYKYMRDS